MTGIPYWGDLIVAGKKRSQNLIKDRKKRLNPRRFELAKEMDTVLSKADKGKGPRETSPDRRRERKKDLMTIKRKEKVETASTWVGQGDEENVIWGHRREMGHLGTSHY